MEFPSITQYLFNDQWNSNPLPNTFIISINGIGILTFKFKLLTLTFNFCFLTFNFRLLTIWTSNSSSATEKTS